ncbi:hypothetical protein WR25_08757 [Diploscapter pachys]|uniref:Uncharacterized protein n=1 Tax=Diploscapter pachys TaxID=2018661 RepID=A0A2A2KJR6_9BILA|nr:hypothetical protein WR25_08757 [Diploscapter pachys]
MMEEDNKKQCKVRLRNTAASLIQNWYRYHRSTHWIVGGGKDYDYFRKFCYRLYLTDERISKNRALAKKMKERIERKKSKVTPSFHHQSSFRETLIKNAQDTMIIPILEASASLEDVSTPQRRRSLSLPEEPGPQFDASQKIQRFREKRDSTEFSISSSCDISDVEKHIELKNALEESLDDVNFRELDEQLLMKYRPLLRFFTFINFRILSRKFKRLRKADQLLTIEEEIAESENIRNIKMKQLEAIIVSLVGKSSFSLLDSKRDKLPALARLELCESRVLEMERKVDAINDVANQIMDLLSSGNTRPINMNGSMSQQRKFLANNLVGKRKKFTRQITVASMMRHRTNSGSDDDF